MTSERFHIEPATAMYYERTTLKDAIQQAIEEIEEWDYAEDPHGYCHERPMLVALVRALPTYSWLLAMPDNNDATGAAPSGAASSRPHCPSCTPHEIRPGVWAHKRSDCPHNVYDIARLADLLGVTEGHVRVWRQRGRLPHEDFSVAGHPAWWHQTIAGWLEELTAVAQDARQAVQGGT